MAAFRLLDTPRTTYESVPQVLREHDQWLVWQWTETADGKRTKVPHCASGGLGSSTNPATWATYDGALAAAEQYSGIGFVVTASDRFVGIDLDHCIDAESGGISEWAQGLVDCFDSYTEVTPSGEGLRIWIEADYTGGKRGMRVHGHPVEVYGDQRYFTVTGQHLEGTPETIETRDEALHTFLQDYGGSETQDNAARSHQGSTARLLAASPALIQQTVVWLETEVTRGTEIGRLWRGQWQTVTNAQGHVLESPSEADLKLLIGLLYKQPLLDDLALDFLVRQSGLYRRKWDSSYYAERTMQKAREWVDAHPLSADLTDSGNAERLWRSFGTQFRYVVDVSRFIIWNGQCWQYDDRNHMQEWAKATAHNILLEAQAAPNSHLSDALVKWSRQSRGVPRIRAMLELVTSIPGVPVRFADLDMHTDKVAVLNGVYNLRTAQLEPPHQEDLITQQLAITAEPGAVSSRWDAFLDLLFDGDEEMIQYFRRTLGYWLTGSTSEHCFYFLHGEGNNGKSTLLAVLRQVLGVFAHHIPVEMLLKRGYGSSPEHHVADCRGKRLVYTEEFKYTDQLNEGLIKEITGGGVQTASRKYEHAIEFPFIARLVIATNRLPSLADVGKAMARRVRAIPFAVDIPARLRAEGKLVPTQEEVVEALMGEAPAILDDLVQAAAEWYREGVGSTPKAVQQATDEYVLDQDPIRQWIEACRDPNPNRQPQRSSFQYWYMSFLGWSGRDKHSTSTRWFALQLANQNGLFTKVKTPSGVCYDGPAWTQEADRAVSGYTHVNEDGTVSMQFPRTVL